MPRIRSIKPEFATDGDMLRLSDSCALFFILLWNFCDDEGKHPLDLKQLAAELGGRWHQGKVKLFVSCLVKSGQLRLNSTSTWVQVTGWSHQRIDNPKQPKVKASELQWLTAGENGIDSDSSLFIPARIGSDRIGSDRIGSFPDRVTEPQLPGLESPPAPHGVADPKNRDRKQPSKPTVEERKPAKTDQVWIAYSGAYRARHGATPLRNREFNALASRLVDKLGAADAPLVAEFYLSHNAFLYVNAKHPMNLAVRDAQKLHTEMLTGRQTTATEARLIDQKQSNMNAWASALGDQHEAQ